MATPSTFRLGANLPWIHYGGDFGANAWRPNGGVASSGVPDTLRRRVDDLRAGGTTTLRWFLFCDARAGIRFAGDGAPLGIDDCVLPDLDAALAFAAGADVQLVFTLFDFLLLDKRRMINGVQTGGRRALIANARHRTALLDLVVAPVVQRFGGHPNIAAWDVINEPEWATLGLGGWRPWRCVMPATMAAFIEETVALIHERASQAVTVGLASARWLSLVRNAGLDFYQVHWYDKLDGVAPLDRAVAALNLDKPIVLGEYPTRGSRYEPDDIVRIAREAGYAGAWMWSVNANDEATR